ncbi:hypothetical protein V6N11_065303 [Hibiscus sabdariffa]|uniref:RNase H type-1 domain-containing protein n=1 Tax=Hibiscus sabdariffa TaxID=183260 RepID=A0ABR2QGI8_9ROSI
MMIPLMCGYWLKLHLLSLLKLTLSLMIYVLPYNLLYLGGIPLAGFIKINCDVFFDTMSITTSAQLSFKMHKDMFCKLAEAYVVCLGLLKALNEGYRQVSVESDNAWLISQLCVKSFSSWDLEAIENDIACAVRFNSCPPNWVSSIPNELLALFLILS